MGGSVKVATVAQERREGRGREGLLQDAAQGASQDAEQVAAHFVAQDVVQD